MKRICKECKRQALPNGNSIANYAARKLGYCRDCYDLKFPMKPVRGRYKSPVSSRLVRELPDIDSEAFNPDSPWDWYEYFFPEKER